MYQKAREVAPFTGAWIETIKIPFFCVEIISRTLHVCVDLNKMPSTPIWRSFVAPFTGAWIETSGIISPRTRRNVAPFTGAWIETKLNQ